MRNPEVWLTESGARYHASDGCPALFEPGVVRHGLRRTFLSDVGKKRSACSRCWPDQPGWDAWTSLEHKVVRGRDSWYEVDFFERVIRRLPGVTARQIEFQRELTDSKGRSRFVDFAVHARNGRRIAIELDGKQKTADARHRSQEAFDAFNDRQNELMLQGWLLLRYSNSRSRLSSEECIAEIQRAMEPSPPDFNGLVDQEEQHPQREVSAPVVADSAARSITSSVGHYPGLRAVFARGAGASQRSRMWILLSLLSAAALALAFVLVLQDGGTMDAEIEPASGHCPVDFPVKGNQSQSGDLIYHEAGWRYYERTSAERCFRDNTAAEGAGYRASEVQ